MIYLALIFLSMSQMMLIGLMAVASWRLRTESAAQSFARSTSFSVGKGGLRYENKARYESGQTRRAPHKRSKPNGGQTQVRGHEATVRRRVNVLLPLLPLLAAAMLTGCSEPKPTICDDICQLEQQQQMHHIEAEMQMETTAVEAVKWLAATNITSLIVLACEVVVLLGRRYVLGIQSPDEREQNLLDARVAILSSRYLQPPSTVHNYQAAEAGNTVEGEFREVGEVGEVARGALPAPRPTAPTWGELVASGCQPTLDRWLLGNNLSGPVYFNLPSSPAIVVGGRPRRGKTTFLRLQAAQMLMVGGTVVCFDAHGSVAGVRKVAGLHQAISNRVGEMDQLADRLDTMLDRRLEAYPTFHQEGRQFPPLLLIADELPRLANMSEAAIAVINRSILEGPKVNIYTVISGQGVSARMMGGSTARDSAGVRVCYDASEQQARMLGFGGRTPNLIAQIGDVQGICYAEGPFAATMLAVPNTVEDDLVLAAAAAQASRPTNPVVQVVGQQPQSQPQPHSYARSYSYAFAPQSPAAQVVQLPVPVTERSDEATARLQVPRFLQVVLDCIACGLTSDRDVAEELRITVYEANKRKKDLRELGLID